jgi:phenylacetate-CoA ligase
VLPVADGLLGQHVSARLRELQAFQWATRREIDAYRARRLQHLVRFSHEKVPFYRERQRRAALKPSDIQSPADLPRLPIVVKQDLRESFEALQVEGYRGRTYEMKSSGSTGMQTTALVDAACNDEVFATQLLFWSWGGFAMGAPHLQTGMSVNRGAVRRLKDVIFRCTYTSAFDLTDATLARTARVIDQRGIRSLFGYASSLYVLARFYETQGLQRRMHSIFTWGDSLFPHYRDLIERVFGCPVNDCYGLGEGLQCAAQCEHHDALHEAMHGVIVEIVDRDGQPCPPGVLGRVVVTRLEPGPMPLIRYDTGDVATFVDGACACGRELQRISRIQGRATDIVTTPAGDRLIVHFFTQILEMIPEVAQFQVRQERAEAIDMLFVPGKGFHAGILDRIRREILAGCTFPLEIRFREVADIPVEASNKRRFVVSSVPF